MKSILRLSIPIVIVSLAVTCKPHAQKEKNSVLNIFNSDEEPVTGTYAYDRNLLKEQGPLIELISDDSSSKVLLSAAWQGRVMTSTARGDSGTSFGWLNYDLLSGGQKRKQFNPVGGEERFWIGPEGGQYGFYFPNSDSFNIAQWQVPAILDTIPYQVVLASKKEAVFATKATLTNYSGSVFNMNIVRKINLLNKVQLAATLGVDMEGIRSVAYETVNSITNAGPEPWSKETGLPSIWLLGMFTPSPQTQVIIPFEPISNARAGITDNYFGTMPADRLKIHDGYLSFTCDGKFRSKIGIAPQVAKPMAAGFDFSSNTLTLVIPEVHKDLDYVNSKWEMQREPYKGDVINAYNDGPLADGTQLGFFYEIESSSPALPLKVNESGTYRQLTCHLQGNYDTLKILAERLLGVNLDEIKPQ